MAVENQVDLHATKMVQRAIQMHGQHLGTAAIGCPLERSSTVFRVSEVPGDALHSHRNGSRLVLLVGALEVGDLVIVLEVPDAGSDFVDQIVVVRDQQDCALIAL